MKFDAAGDDPAGEFCGGITQTNLVEVFRGDTRNPKNMIAIPERAPRGSDRFMMCTPSSTRGSQPHTQNTTATDPAQNQLLDVWVAEVKTWVSRNVNRNNSKTRTTNDFANTTITRE